MTDVVRASINGRNEKVENIGRIYRVDISLDGG